MMSFRISFICTQGQVHQLMPGTSTPQPPLQQGPPWTHVTPGQKLSLFIKYDRDRKHREGLLSARLPASFAASTAAFSS